jgi:hypothetical protein
MIATDAALRARGSARARTRTSVRVRRLLGRVRCARPTLGDSSAPSFLFLFFRFVSPLFSSSPTATRPSGGDPPTRFRCHPPAAQCPCLFVRVVYSPSPLSAALMARGVWWQPSDTPNRKKRKNIRAFCWGVSSGRRGGDGAPHSAAVAAGRSRDAAGFRAHVFARCGWGACRRGGRVVVSGGPRAPDRHRRARHAVDDCRGRVPPPRRARAAAYDHPTTRAASPRRAHPAACRITDVRAKPAASRDRPAATPAERGAPSPPSPHRGGPRAGMMARPRLPRETRLPQLTLSPHPSIHRSTAASREPDGGPARSSCGWSRA